MKLQLSAVIQTLLCINYANTAHGHWSRPRIAIVSWKLKLKLCVVCCVCVVCVLCCVVTVITCCSMSVMAAELLMEVSVILHSAASLISSVLALSHVFWCHTITLPSMDSHSTLQLTLCTTTQLWSQIHKHTELHELKLLTERKNCHSNENDTEAGKQSGSSPLHQRQHCFFLYVPITCCSLCCQLISSIKDVVSTVAWLC